jgi:hypothetical protein
VAHLQATRYKVTNSLFQVTFMKEKQDSQQVFVIKQEKKTIRLWSDNFLSNWFFIWVFPIIQLGKEKNPLLFNFELRKQETARVNVDKLDQAWQRELQRNPRYTFIQH